MKLDRALQLRILQVLAASYPEPFFRFPGKNDLGANSYEVISNLFYLHEHKLVSCTFINDDDGLDINGSVRITADGLDFLEADGGLSAILGTVTIKFHEDSLKQLIELRLSEAQLPTEEKHRLLQSVRELPADSIKHLTTRLLDLGMDNLPRAVELIRTILT